MTAATIVGHEREVRFGSFGRTDVRLDEPAALAWHERTIAVSHSRTDRLARQVERLPGGRWAARALVHRRLTSVGSVEWEAAWARAAALLGPALDEALAPWVVVRDYAGTGRGRTILFLFADGDAAPRAALKVRSLDGVGRALAAEWDALHALAAVLPPALAAQVPHPLAIGAGDDAEAMLVSMLPGRSGYVELHGSLAPSRRADAHLLQATEWLWRFQQAARPAATGTLDVGALCERWSRLHARWALDERDTPMAIAGFDALAAAPPVARTMAHGDFWARNVLFADGRVSGVVDWEHAANDASPFDDLFHYAIAYGAAWPWSTGRPDAGHAFACTFVTDTRVSRAVDAALSAWRSRAGVRARAMRSLFLLHLLERAEAAAQGAAHGDVHGAAQRDLALTRDYWLACYRTIAQADRSVFSG